MSGSNSKKKRKQKISKGLNKARKHPLQALQKALLGKGQLQDVPEVECSPWRGVQMVNTPWDAEGVAENKRLYPHLFEDDRR